MAETGGLFVIDAETGDTTQFTGTLVVGANTITATAGSKNNGSYGFDCSFDGSNSRAAGYKTVTAGGEFYARVYICFVTGFQIGQYGACELIGIYKTSYSGTRCGDVYATRYAAGNGIPDRIAIEGVGTAAGNVAFTWVADTRYCVEVHYKQNNGAGGTEVWVDGILKSSDMNNDTSANDADYILAGNSRSTPTAACHMYLDDFKTDTSAVGAYSDTGGSIVPLAMHHYKQQGTH